VLKDIQLSFLPRCERFGVGSGVNGSGKSTLLKIMAGIDKGIHGRGLGRRRPIKGSVILRRSRKLDPAKDCARQNAMEGRGGKRRGACRPLYKRDRRQLFPTRRRTRWRACKNIHRRAEFVGLGRASRAGAGSAELPPARIQMCRSFSGGEEKRSGAWLLVALLLSRPGYPAASMSRTNHPRRRDKPRGLQHYLEDYQGCINHRHA